MRSDQDPALLRAFAAELKARRSALGLSQDRLALAAEVHRTFVAKLERALTMPSLSSLYRIAEGLDIEPAEFISAISKRYRKELRNSA
jgi:transcriptional regulator with XRE-family HTH domain